MDVAFWYERITQLSKLMYVPRARSIKEYRFVYRMTLEDSARLGLYAKNLRAFEPIDRLNRAHTNANIVLVCHSGVMAALKASHIGQDFAEHNISEAYPHDYVAKFTFDNGTVTAFTEFLGL